MKTSDAIDWLRPFHDAAGGRTGDALNLAMAAIDDAPDDVRAFALREGLRIGLHALRRSSPGIRVNGDAETMPLFVATEDLDGTVVHTPRYLVTVEQIDFHIRRWGARRSQADREFNWWTHQRDLAKQSNAEPDEVLVDMWKRLGVPYDLFIGEPAAAVA